jgi:hypothetical protein
MKGVSRPKRNFIIENYLFASQSNKTPRNGFAISRSKNANNPIRFYEIGKFKSMKNNYSWSNFKYSFYNYF